MSRRVVASLVLLSALLFACGGDDDDEAPPLEPIPSTATMMSWIEEIVAQGIRRPGYAADDWTERWAVEMFERLGLENITLDPIDVERWEPLSWSLEVWRAGDPGERLMIPAYPVPFSGSAEALEGDVRLATETGGEDVAGAIAVMENQLIALPQRAMTGVFANWFYDPANDFETLTQVLPFSGLFQDAMEPAIAAGAAAYVGILRGFPWDTDRYYVPYDAHERPIPGLWISANSGDALLAFMQGGPTRGRIALERTLETVTSHNVTATLPGNSDEWIVIGSHHDGPWASAVEDGTGIALVMAQAQYWSQVPRAERPHNLMFLLNGGHMSGGAGLIHFTETMRDFISNDVVVELHLEHAAREVRGDNGELIVTANPEPRWWFTSLIPPLQQAVADAICRHDLRRSLMMPPDGFPPGSANPPTDAAFFHPHSPIVSFLTAPVYLFDEQDTIDKVHEASLVPLTEATIDIIEAMADHTAASLRAQVYEGERPSQLECASAVD